MKNMLAHDKDAKDHGLEISSLYAKLTVAKKDSLSKSQKNITITPSDGDNQMVDHQNGSHLDANDDLSKVTADQNHELLEKVILIEKELIDV